MNMWLVGAGYWGSKLLDNLSRLGVCATVIDIKNGQTIDDIHDLAPVILATPLWDHHAQAKRLLQNGHDVYVEKPLAQTVAEIDDISDCVRSGQLLMVGHLFVHHPQMQQIRQMIQDDVIGDLQHVSSCRHNWGIYQTKTDPLLSLAVHDISILQQVCDDVQVCQAQAWTYSPNCQWDRVRFNGSAGTVTFDIDVSWLWPVRQRQTVFMGSAGQIVWDQDLNIITLTKHFVQDRRAVVDDHAEVFTLQGVTPLEAELRHWVDCVSLRQTPLSDAGQARDIAQVVEQVKSLL